MDRLNSLPVLSKADTPHLAEDGLVLWQMSGGRQHRLWCLVYEFPDGFHLVIDDDPEGDQPSLFVERHSDIVAVLDRAASWRFTFRTWGWVDVDVE